MIHKKFLKDLHIGELIKKVALEKGITSGQIANAANRSKSNASKIFRMDDMDINEVILISYRLEFCILYFIVKEYMAHLPFIAYDAKNDYCLLKADMKKNHISTYNAFNNCDFLKEINIGKQIREVMKQNHWNEDYLATRLGCTQGMVSQLLRNKSLKVKKLIEISDILQYDFISRVYLSQIMIAPDLNFLEHCIISVSRQEVNIRCSKTGLLLMQFCRNYTEK
jgi:transcriptional regulator with XRE-family HTH domain